MRSSQIEVYSNKETKQCIAISQQFDIIDFFCVTHAPTSYKPLINNELKNPCSPSKKLFRNGLFAYFLNHEAMAARQRMAAS